MTTTERIKAYKKSLGQSCRPVKLTLWAAAGAAAFMGCFGFLLMGSFSPLDNAFFSLFVHLYGMLCCGGIVLLPALFREFYSKADADSVYSLPLSGTERFAAKLWLLAEYQLLPVVTAGAAVGLFALLFCGSNEWARGLVLRYLLVMLSQTVFADGAGLLFICFTGSLLCSVYVPAAATLMLSLVPELAVGCYRAFSGIYFNSVEPPMDVLENFGVIDLVRSLMGSHYIDAPDDSIAVMIVLELVLAAVFGLLALVIYRRRSGLQTGWPFANGVFYLIFISFAIVMGYAAGLRNRTTFSAIILALGAGFIVAGTRYRKSFRLHELCVTLLHCFGAMVGATAALFVVYITYGFGGEHPAPDRYVTDKSQLYFYANDNFGELRGGNWSINESLIYYKGTQQEAAEAIFEELERFNAVKPRHTAGNFIDFLVFGNEEGYPDLPRSGTISYRLECVEHNDYKDKYYYCGAIIKREQDEELFKALEARGVPVIYVDPDIQW